MHRKKQIILLVDNKETFLDVQADLLIYEGYQVLKAKSIPLANQILQEKQVHLIISDIRMEDEDHPEDVSGLLWVQEERYRPLPKIVLTAYPEEYIRETLNLVLDDMANIVGFVSKPDGPARLQEVINKTFTEKIRVNWNLNIRRNQNCSPTHLISVVEPNIPPSLFETRIQECEDALRQLFFAFTQVTFGRILTSTPGHVILEVFAYNEAGNETQYVVSFGQRALITNENERNEAMPKGRGVGSTRWANELPTVETMRFAATGYQLVEGDLETMTSFSTYYRSRSATESIDVLNYLYKTTLAPWYQDGLSKMQYTLPDFVPDILLDDLTNSLSEKIEFLCQQTMTAGVANLTCDKHQIYLQINNNNPVVYKLPTQDILTSLPAQDVLQGTIHGRINGNTVRLNPEGVTWLIDFKETGSGDLLRDFAWLEIHIKYRWLRSVSVQDRFLLEQSLLDMESLDTVQDDVGMSAETTKAFSLIAHLRQLAAYYLNTTYDSYMLGLCAYTLDYFNSFKASIRYRRGELESYVHTLLSIAMLCEALSTRFEPAPGVPPQAASALWLDDINKCIWVEGKEVRLTPQEYNLLAYLNTNKRQLCTRDEITKHVWHDDEEPIWSKGRLDATIGRVRQKIESDSKKPKHLLTVRGQGYKLMV